MLFTNTSKRIMSICASGRGFTVWCVYGSAFKCKFSFMHYKYNATSPFLPGFQHHVQDACTLNTISLCFVPFICTQDAERAVGRRPHVTVAAITTWIPSSGRHGRGPAASRGHRQRSMESRKYTPVVPGPQIIVPLLCNLF